MTGGCHSRRTDAGGGYLFDKGTAAVCCVFHIHLLF
ncbi:hypothetical protein Barb7_00550 [Bacteroidales bacterium Barb7]|nr:hypothetical protein Barb7_00550 [Bacteroidales bacterium Barb7]